ncbi:MAG: DUF2334 domain-containing protein [Firmicutes bacterium]|nr:DUF2334 domain-containing protein [Bacillota bacterium]
MLTDKKRKRIKTAAAVLAAALVLLTVLSSCGKKEEPAPAVDLPPAFSGEYSVLYGGEETGAAVRLYGTRPYIGRKPLSEALGREAELPSSPLFPPREYEGEEYISLADASLAWGLEVLFTDEEKIFVWERKEPEWPVPQGLEKAQDPCYIRLEDIMADGGLNGRFTHENLQKLRVMASYLSAVTEGYYIAWIPLYVNPGLSVKNDISRDVSFYNADFVFTLDCMTACGGRIGLHGLSHQKKDEVSADGYEFGKRCGLSKDEIVQKFNDAKDIASRLGYEVSFWEFPHYEATKKQADLAAESFDLIYQCHPDHKNDRALDRRMYGEREVVFLPTPADYVYSEYDKDGILERLASLSGDDARSLFMHPSMDYRNIYIRKDGKTAVPYYDAEGILPAVVLRMAAEGRVFSCVK